MPLTTYCGYNEVRSALGVNHLELPDTVIALPVYEMGLTRELTKLSTSLAASFSTIASKVAGDRSDAEEALFSAVRLFSVYLVASQVGVSLPNFAPKSVDDGKTSLSRFSGEPYEAVMTRVLEARDRYRMDVREAIAGLGSATTTAYTPTPLMARASPRLTDPVTGS